MNASKPGVILGLLAIFVLAALPARASDSALSQASAMGALEAMRQAPGIELRDARNRVISREALGREARQGVRRMADDAAALSKVQGLGALMDYLERKGQLAAKWSDGEPAAARQAAAVPAQPVRSPKLVPPSRCAALHAPDAGRLDTLSPLQLRYTPGRVRVLVLRE